MKQNKTKILALTFILFGFLCLTTLATSMANAEEAPDSTGLNETADYAKLPKADIQTILGSLAGGVLALSGSVFLFLMVYGGFILLTSQGEKEGVTKGKNIIKWAIIGAVLLASAYAITSLIFTTLTQTPTP